MNAYILTYISFLFVIMSAMTYKYEYNEYYTNNHQIPDYCFTSQRHKPRLLTPYQ